MSGDGRKTWSAGDILTAADLNGYVMDQAVMNFAGTAARASAIPSPSEGMVTHIGGGTVQVYNGTAWVALGGVPNAVISSPAKTGSYTSGGTAFDYWTLTASGTVVCDTAGFADVLVVGGGGSGGHYGGGGGAGGHLQIANAYLPAGSLTVTVGAGGSFIAQQASELGQGNNGNASLIGSYIAPGGGAGASLKYTASSTTAYGSLGLNGGSGGGGANSADSTARAGGSGVSGIGNSGGSGNTAGTGGGGGGAGAAGSAGTGVGPGNGGNGLANDYTGSSVTRAGGGGGSSNISGTSTGGTGGGGNSQGGAGGANTGGGGGSGGSTVPGNGGSGVVIIRVKV